MSEGVVAGGSDIFGFGVRIGFYLTGLSLILSKIFCPSRLSGIATSIGLLEYAIFFALIKNVLQGSPAMLNLYLVFLLTQVISLMFQVVYENYVGRFHAEGLRGVIFFLFEMIIVIWIVFRKRHSVLDQYPHECARTVRFFGLVDITGKFGTFIGAFMILCVTVIIDVILVSGLVYLMLWIYRIMRKPQPAESIPEEQRPVISRGLRQRLPNSDINGAWDENIVKILYSGAEYDIIETVRVEHGCTVLGQLMPHGSDVTIDVANVLSVFWGFVDDRWLNIAGERIYQDNQRAVYQPFFAALQAQELPDPKEWFHYTPFWKETRTTYILGEEGGSVEDDGWEEMADAASLGSSDPPPTAPAGEKEWTTVEGNRSRKRRRKGRKDKDGAVETASGTKGNARRSQKSSATAKKTWTDVVKAGGMNVQIVPGSNNLGQAIPQKKRGREVGWSKSEEGEFNSRGMGERSGECFYFSLIIPIAKLLTTFGLETFCSYMSGKEHAVKHAGG
ncbi:hypothetical protein FPQ18DRAFT_301490 [Pyronema domesticum]|nr:hypothetical protein FPQ18DRAFT_301490 [Pyronema domesticum]